MNGFHTIIPPIMSLCMSLWMSPIGRRLYRHVQVWNHVRRQAHRQAGRRAGRQAHRRVYRRSHRRAGRRVYRRSHRQAGL